MKKVALIILDGWGHRQKKAGNAIANAKTPNFDFYWKHYPHTLLGAHGSHVGLPKNILGGSEVGHFTIGSGRIEWQELMRINNAIKDRSFFSNNILIRAMKEHGALHLIGLVSDGGVHSHITHLIALIQMAKHHGKNALIHVITDGRDTEAKSALRYVAILEKEIRKQKWGKIATVMGRYYAMDRDNRWNRTERAYNALLAIDSPAYKTAGECIRANYRRGITDEFIMPATIADFFGINDKDTLLFFNFRSDRAKQLTHAFVDRYFMPFKRKRVDICFYSMCEYRTGTDFDVKVAFHPIALKNSLGEIISRHSMKQLRVAETEKYPHVTYFFSCGRETPFRGEDCICIPSPRVATYDLQPEMSAYIVAESMIAKIAKKQYHLVLLNFANADMVGHCGNYCAAVRAVEHVDINLKKVVDALQERDYEVIITADHGNAEEMTGKHRTTHTLNSVPFILVSKKKVKLKKGGLENIAPTVLKLLKMKKPKEMKAGALF